MRRRHDTDRAPRLDGGAHRARLLVDLPVLERRVCVAGVETSILEGGSGPPLILLHGGIECGGVVWGPVVTELARSHRLVIPDLPGLGDSAPVAALAATFDSWLEELVPLTCQGKPTLVAHSLSGGLAARFAIRHGDLLRRLVIYSSPAIAPGRLPMGLQLAAIRFAVRPTAANNERINRWFFLDLDKTRGQDEAWYHAFDAYSRSRGTVPHVKRTMSHLLKTQRRRLPDTELDRLAEPVALLWGRHDRVIPRDVGEAARDRHGWPLHVVDDSGHVPHIEQPAAFLRALSDIELGARTTGAAPSHPPPPSMETT